MASQRKGVSILRSGENVQLKCKKVEDAFCHSEREKLLVASCAIIGPSRSGKSSFFNLLAQLLKEQKVRTNGIHDGVLRTTVVGGGGAGGKTAPQTFWFGENPGKICRNFGKMCVNFRKIAVGSFDFTRMAPKMKVQTIFSGGHVFIYLFSGNLGEIWAKMVLEVRWFEKVRPTKCKRVFLEVTFFGNFFGQVWGNLGKNSSQPQKFACIYTNASYILISHSPKQIIGVCGRFEYINRPIQDFHAVLKVLKNNLIAE